MPDAAAHAARFDLWAGGETLEAGPTACSMRWRPRKPLVECTCPDLDVTTYAAHAEGVIDTMKGWNPDSLASHGTPVVQLPEDMAGTVGTTRVLDERHVFTLADMEAASAAVRALHAPPVDAGSEPQTYATGGLVSSGTLAIVGEDGGCTMPLPWWRRMLGGTS